MSYRTPSDADTPSTSFRRVETLLRVEVLKLDVAKGHDGFLRGKPEPVVVIGVYLIEYDRPVLLERRMCRFKRPQVIPSTVVSEGLQRIDRLENYALPATFAILGVALEHDEGVDIAEAYAALEQPDDILFSTMIDGIQAADELGVVAQRILSRGRPERLRLYQHGRDRADSTRHDDWIGASIVGFSGAHRKEATERMHFLSDDGRNDWTMSVFIRLRTPHRWPDD